MGDTGALPLGGGLAVVAFMTGQWLVLPLIGDHLLARGTLRRHAGGYLPRHRRQAASSSMAPLHHHFEKLGWGEVQVTQRFWIVGALGAAVGIVLALEV